MHTENVIKAGQTSFYIECLRISEEARTLESQALSLQVLNRPAHPHTRTPAHLHTCTPAHLQSSPPDTGQGEVFPSGLEPLTPSPVTQAARKVTYQVLQGHSVIL